MMHSLGANSGFHVPVFFTMILMLLLRLLHREHVLFIWSVNKRTTCPVQGEPLLSINVVRMKLDLCCFPDNPIHVSGFLDQDTVVM